MGNKVLFIDNAGRFPLISKILSREGYEVDTADSGEDGIEQLESRSDDVVIMVDSPTAQVWTTVERIRNLTNAPIIVISLNASTETSVKAIKAGADYFLRKYFGPRELLARINSLLQRNRSISIRGG